MRPSVLSTALFASLASAICHHGTDLWARDEAAPKAAAFGYTGEIGPSTWHTLSPNWTTCATGKFQSPIDILPGAPYLRTVKGAELRLALDDCPRGAELENLGTTIEVKNVTGSVVREGKTYSLVQFHFHTTSEHTFEGEAFALEVHFVFQAAGMFFPTTFSFRCLVTCIPQIITTDK
jgi:carbonic anhydrase